MYAPDGRTVLTASGDGTARIWELDYRVMVARACDRLHSDFYRNKFIDERQLYNITDGEPTCPQFATSDHPVTIPLPPTATPLDVKLPVWTPIPSPTP